jgi:hypothetical protein
VRTKSVTRCLCPNRQRNDFMSDEFRLKRGGKITLSIRGGAIKPNWYEWHCTHETENGWPVEGTVQADYTGDLIAPETFELE